MLDVDLTSLDEARHIIVRLQQENKLLRTVIDTVPSLIYVKDTQSRFLLANRMTLEHMNLPEEAAIIGKSDVDFHEASKAAQFRAEEEKVLFEGFKMLHHEQEVINHQNGQPAWYSTSKVVFYDDDGAVAGLIGINHDVTDRKQTELQLQALRAELEKRVEERTAALQQSQQQVIEMQAHLLKELSIPVIPLLQELILLPIIGSVDELRARDLLRALLAGISVYRARIVLLDITGVPLVDSGVADHLNKAIQAAKLKGAHTIVTGISEAVAETIVDLGIDWSSFQTLRNLESGLRAAFDMLGLTLTTTKK